MTTKGLRRIAIYARVSSEDQRDRETIRTQMDALAERFANDPTVEKVTWYVDDGISGTIPMAERPQGRRLIQAALAGEFDELWIYNVKRLGRNAIGLLIISRQFEQLGIRLFSLQEGELTGLGYDVQAVVADHDRRQFLRLSADSMNRAAKEGRYTGGIVPLGYVVLDRKQHAYLIPSDEIIWSNWTESDLVRQIYKWLAIDGWSCRRIADHLNGLGVPTAYGKVGKLVKIKRGQRKERTQGLWRAGRIGNLVKNPVYRGEQQYGRRSKTSGRKVILGEVPALVTKEIWEAAQVTLSGNRLMAKNTERNYLLKSVIHCGICGRTYIGSWGRSFVWYRCNGRLTDRRPVPERCTGMGLKGPDTDSLVWDDVERFLRDPGDILEELSREKEMDAGAAVAEAERVTLESAMSSLARRRKKAIDLSTRDLISDAELDEVLAEVAREREGVAKRLDELQEAASEPDEPLDPDLLEEVRRRLECGLNNTQRQEVVRLLVKRITVCTEVDPEGKKKARVLVEYRFHGVVNVSTDTGSWPPPS